MDFSNDKNITGLSNLGLYYYVYSNVLGFDKKENSDDGTIKSLSAKGEGGNIVKELGEALASVGIPCCVVNAKKSVKNFAKKNRSHSSGHDALLVTIDDSDHLTSGIFYADPILDTKTRKSGTVCHSLLRLDSAADLLSKNGKYEINTKSFNQLKAQTEMLSEIGLSVQMPNFETLKERLAEDEDFKNGFKFYIENFTQDIYEMKAKDKSVNRYIHPYFGEGKKPYDASINQIFIQVFEALFKRACARKLNHLVSDFDRETRHELERYFADVESKVKDAKVLVKIFSENYENITPHIFEEVMNESILDGDYFAENTNYFKDYKYVSEIERLIANHNNLENLASDYFTVLPTADEIEDALAEALAAQGKPENVAQNMAQKIMFSSMLSASSNWNINAANAQAAGPFSAGLEDMQQTKY